jgi:hypothetical protein
MCRKVLRFGALFLGKFALTWAASVLNLRQLNISAARRLKNAGAPPLLERFCPFI